MDEKQTCAARVRPHFESRMAELRKLWFDYCDGKDEDGFLEYGLSVDYVPAGTFAGQRGGYLRYLLSWGGPSDEFRFFLDARRKCYRIEYWFLDWFDGAHIVLEGEDENLMLEILQWCDDAGIVQSEIEKATDDE